MNNSVLFHSSKKQGEWVELQFMARAAAHGLTVSKPWGDSSPYDCVVESDRVFNRVQVKSTAKFRDNAYECAINDLVAKTRRRRYAPGDFDFYAIYLVREDLWYVIPASAVERKRAIALNPHYRKSRYISYLEAWHLLAGAPSEHSGRDSCLTAR
jgi:hypothetical protein